MQCTLGQFKNYVDKTGPTHMCRIALNKSFSKFGLLFQKSQVYNSSGSEWPHRHVLNSVLWSKKSHGMKQQTWLEMTYICKNGVKTCHLWLTLQYANHFFLKWVLVKVLESMREDALLKISAQFCQFSGQFLKNSLLWWRRFRISDQKKRILLNPLKKFSLKS